MRILVVAPTFLPLVGGAELVLFEVFRRIARRHDVRFVVPVPSPELLRELAADEYAGAATFPVERYDDRWSFMRLRGHRASAGAIPPFSLSAVAATIRTARRFRPDVVNVHYAMPTGLAALVADRALGIPAVVTLNGRDVPGPGVPRLWRWWQRALLSSVTDVTYVSAYCREAIYGAGAGRGEVVPNGVEIPAPPGDGESVRRALEVPAGEPIVFALQRLAREKRVDVLLHALRRCLDVGVPATLVIGGQGPEAPGLVTLAERLGIVKHVRFAGYIPRDALAGYFEACEVFAFHSTFETFGVVVAQAMSHGRPVVSVRNTALPEVIGDAGILVPTGDASAFGDALARLLGDAALRRQLGEAGRRRAETRFDWDRIAERYEDVLDRAARRRRSR